jgi:phosphatidylglycerophosphatase A
MPLLTPLPGALRWYHPAAWISTWFGAGLLPKMPGTFGSIAALPFGWLIHTSYGSTGLLVATALVFIAGWWSTAGYIAADGRSDPGMVVVDEVAGVWLTLAFVSLDVEGYIAAFLLFRFFDIVKPWPVRSIERSVPGALGVMVDDIAAAVFAIVVYILFATYTPFLQG